MSQLLHHTPHPLLRRLHWSHKRPSPAALAGDYRSAFRGRGMEFDQVVKYTYGDDMRTIDWNVTARRGEPYRKQYIEERELTVHVLFEDSTGMSFGSTEKTRRETALDFFALLTHLCAQNRDRLAATHISPTTEWHQRPVRGRSSLYALAHRIIEMPPATQQPIDNERLSRVMRTCLRVLPRHTIFIWISDFAPRQMPPEWNLLRKRFLCIGARPDDPWDIATPQKGAVAVLDPVTNESMTLDWSRSAIRKQHTTWRNDRENSFQKLFPGPLDRLTLPTVEPIVQSFVKFLQKRKDALNA